MRPFVYHLGTIVTEISLMLNKCYDGIMRASISPTVTKLFWFSFLIAAAVMAAYVYWVGRLINDSYAYVQVVTVSDQRAVKTVSFPDKSGKLSIPDWSLFKTGNIWSLTSNSHPLPASFTATDIVKSPVDHAEDADMISAKLSTALLRLTEAAKEEGHPLMLSSAYRSITDQQNLYDQFVATKGRAMADIYVAKPGTSEHHTGLAVDFADTSPKCRTDSNACNLSDSTGRWLQQHAADYGFILRYPEGKKPITGIAYEPWHYRYLGVTLAKAIDGSGLTLDEALRQMYPAFRR